MLERSVGEVMYHNHMYQHYEKCIYFSTLNYQYNCAVYCMLC
jgi:hypothetical protein